MGESYFGGPLQPASTLVSVNIAKGSLVIEQLRIHYKGDILVLVNKVTDLA